MIICGTGHRPTKLGGYSVKAFNDLIFFAEKWLKENKIKATGVISGMALGWDQALAIAAIRNGINLTCAIPFKGQELAWPSDSQKLFNRILDKSQEIFYVSKGSYSPSKMQIRNKWMVDRSDLVLAMWDGSSGGTANCIKYAEGKNKTVINLYNEYKE